jgi:hypothetical protein
VAQKKELLLKSSLKDIGKGKLNVSRIFLIFLFIYKGTVARILTINALQE